jgi:hypothetical protein
MESFAPYASAAEGGPAGAFEKPRRTLEFFAIGGSLPWKMRRLCDNKLIYIYIYIFYIYIGT